MQKILLLLSPILLLLLALDIYCLIDLSRRDKVRFNKKWIWALVILASTPLGPILYLLFREGE